MSAARSAQAPIAIHRLTSDAEDAYDAPTKVGQMSKAAVEKLMRDADAPPHSAPSSGVRPRVVMERETDAPIPVLYDDEADDFEPTRLTGRVSAPSPTTIALMTRGPASIVASLVRETAAQVEADARALRSPAAEPLFPVPIALSLHPAFPFAAPGATEWAAPEAAAGPSRRTVVAIALCATMTTLFGVAATLYAFFH